MMNLALPTMGQALPQPLTFEDFLEWYPEGLGTLSAD
jgi:hypothetical protein